MTTHSLFSPSSAHRWLACPGSMSFPENREQGGSSTFADDGTATHHWAAAVLKGENCELGASLTINDREYILDDERNSRIQDYCADVRRRAIGGHLFVETHVDLSDCLGEGEGGTADVVIALPAKRLGIVEDLKDGSGEKVWASYCVKPATDTTPEVSEPNPQLALYALGILPSLELFGEIDNMLLVIYQPKLNHIDEFKISVADLLAFGERAKLAVVRANDSPPELNPGTKQCRWCRVKTHCPALAKFVQDEIKSDFEVISAAPPVAPRDSVKLAAAYVAVPLIEQWCAAVISEMQKRVAEGEKIIGPDNQPFKYVEGKEGSRKWTDEKAAEQVLLGQLGPKAYTEPKVITAPAAAKLLDKKATKALWSDMFEPLISRPRGKPILTLGSDERPAFSGAAKAEDFIEIAE